MMFDDYITKFVKNKWKISKKDKPFDKAEEIYQYVCNISSENLAKEMNYDKDNIDLLKKYTMNYLYDLMWKYYNNFQ